MNSLKWSIRNNNERGYTSTHSSVVPRTVYSDNSCVFKAIHCLVAQGKGHYSTSLAATSDPLVGCYIFLSGKKHAGYRAYVPTIVFNPLYKISSLVRHGTREHIQGLGHMMWFNLWNHMSLQVSLGAAQEAPEPCQSGSDDFWHLKQYCMLRPLHWTVLFVEYHQWDLKILNPTLSICCSPSLSNHSFSS